MFFSLYAALPLNLEAICSDLHFYLLSSTWFDGIFLFFVNCSFSTTFHVAMSCKNWARSTFYHCMALKLETFISVSRSAQPLLFLTEDPHMIESIWRGCPYFTVLGEQNMLVVQTLWIWLVARMQRSLLTVPTKGFRTLVYRTNLF